MNSGRVDRGVSVVDTTACPGGVAAEMPVALASVFLSYSHDSPEHAARVKKLASQLHAAGLTVALDQAVAPEPAEGWSLWCRQHALYAKTVLVVCSAQYKRRWEQRDLLHAGMGVGWEAHLLRAKFLHEEYLRNPRMRPVLLAGSQLEDVPIELRDWKVYRPLESADDMSELVDRIKEAAAPEPFVTVSRPTQMVTPSSRPMRQYRHWTLRGIEALTVLISAVLLAGTPHGTSPAAPLVVPGVPEASLGTEVTWIRIEGGKFIMTSSDTPSLTGDAREEIVKPFFVSRHEITVKQYRECVNGGACAQPGTEPDCNWNVPGRESHPINCVSWHDASKYTEWSARQLHRSVRLPTEIEFEYLASHRGEAKYPWGSDAPTCQRATLSFDTPCATTGTSSVCSHEAATGVELCDVIGNVWEWSADWHVANISAIVRGGSWQQRPDDVDARTRHWRELDDQEATIGFRVVYSN
jgi:formylglycine-generating enzyme required for sulfatase activity